MLCILQLTVGDTAGGLLHHSDPQVLLFAWKPLPLPPNPRQHHTCMLDRLVLQIRETAKVSIQWAS